MCSMISRRALVTLAFGATLAVAGCSATTTTTGNKTRPETLDAKGFAELIAEPGVVVVDVRTPEEYQAGHLRDALLIGIADPDFADQIAKLDKSKTYALYCRSGNRSGQALAYMRKAGFTQVHHLGGGIGAWQSAGGEVVTG